MFVTEDGAETDLDLGHYERFIRTKIYPPHNFTTGRIDADVLRKERRGDSSGRHHSGDPAHHQRHQGAVIAGAEGHQVAIVEVGGTVVIQSLPFLEAIPSAAAEAGPQQCHVHAPDAGSLPEPPPAKRRRSRPSTVKELLSIGISARRAYSPLRPCHSAVERAKIAPSRNVPERAVISMKDVDSIHKIPALLSPRIRTLQLPPAFRLECKEADSAEWEQVIYEEAEPDATSDHRHGRQVRSCRMPYKSVVTRRCSSTVASRPVCPSPSKYIDSHASQTRAA
ncbi:hypothetical protein ACLK19_18540 [Escherichia coli]